MNEHMLFQQMEFIRFRTLSALEATTEKQADVIPSGFKNSIRWNLGHILLSQENLLYSFVGENDKKSLPAHYGELFGFNTSPHTWKEETPPSLHELREELSAQTKRMKEAFSGRLGEEGQKPFTLGEKFSFTTLGRSFILCQLA